MKFGELREKLMMYHNVRFQDEYDHKKYMYAKPYFDRNIRGMSYECCPKYKLTKTINREGVCVTFLKYYYKFTPKSFDEFEVENLIYDIDDALTVTLNTKSVLPKATFQDDPDEARFIVNHVDWFTLNFDDPYLSNMSVDNLYLSDVDDIKETVFPSEKIEGSTSLPNGCNLNLYIRVIPTNNNEFRYTITKLQKAGYIKIEREDEKFWIVIKGKEEDTAYIRIPIQYPDARKIVAIGITHYGDLKLCIDLEDSIIPVIDLIHKIMEVFHKETVDELLREVLIMKCDGMEGFK